MFASHTSRATGLTLLLACVLNPLAAFALGEKSHITFAPQSASFPIAAPSHATSILLDANEWPGVRHAAQNLTTDIASVTGLTPSLLTAAPTHADNLILIGTLNHSALIDTLIAHRKLNIDAIRNHWETSITQVIDNPLPGIRRALVIVGADKRGTIFGIYDLSEQIGVSPWSWWADVPIPHHDALYLTPGTYLQPEPRVRYRGIFLNDEAPALSGWAQEKFGGFNHRFYEHVFDLLLRLKANFLWPAMWGSAFNEDDPLNPQLADEYGIVMSTSHHEPMMRAQQEWKRHGTGPWDYTTNAATLDAFWRAGVRRNKNYEQLTTIGMRGDGDMAMSRRHQHCPPRAHRRRPAQDPHRRSQPRHHQNPSGLGPLQRSPGLLRSRHARPRRRHPPLVRRQLGQPPPPPHPRRAQTPRRRRHLLPLRLRRGFRRNYKWLNTVLHHQNAGSR